MTTEGLLRRAPSHGDLLHTPRLIHRRFGHGPASRGGIWLPPYHDRGLIGGALRPRCGGSPVTLPSPLDALARPRRWRRAVGRYRATAGGGPNFAYDLCAREATPEEVAGLDSGSQQVTFTGAARDRSRATRRATWGVAKRNPSGNVRRRGMVGEAGRNL